MFKEVAKKHPGIEFLNYNPIGDETQDYFLQLLGEPKGSVSEKLRKNMEYLNNSIDHFSYFLDTGDHHSIVRSNKFYTTSAKGISLYEWTKRVYDGLEVENVNN